ncbi:hypothetical protein DFQ30_009931 [Apophysomyces sp. BC1015]|nr:hypothetical protein DFQ30_009931 [Apophysomyces sp. BC1015]
MPTPARQRSLRPSAIAQGGASQAGRSPALTGLLARGDERRDHVAIHIEKTPSFDVPSPEVPRFGALSRHEARLSMRERRPRTALSRLRKLPDATPSGLFGGGRPVRAGSGERLTRSGNAVHAQAGDWIALANELPGAHSNYGLYHESGRQSYNSAESDSESELDLEMQRLMAAMSLK